MKALNREARHACQIFHIGLITGPIPAARLLVHDPNGREVAHVGLELRARP